MSTLFAIFDWRSIAVLRRNALVYFRNWKTAFFPPAMEPVIFFVAFGLGLGTYVGSLAYDGTDVPYATWVAPGVTTDVGGSHFHRCHRLPGTHRWASGRIPATVVA
jgi:hypothetical protein